MSTARLCRPAWGGISLAVVVFALLWILNAPYRQVYQPGHDDVTALADGSLLLPQAHWPAWFTRGHSDFFDTYPEWAQHDTAFARPVFQFVIYLAHFLFGVDWSSYLVINYASIAGVASIAFAIARTALGLGTGASVLAAVLTLLSSAVLEFSVGVLGAASECLASILVGCGFLAVIARRDVLCVLLLLLALLTKETAAWAPLAASLTVLLRPPGDRLSGRRAIVAAGMLLPLAAWLGIRFGFFDGVGGTYATADYMPISAFLKLSALKLRHFHHLFVAQVMAASEWQWPVVDRTIRIGAALLVILLLTPWVLSSFRIASDLLGRAWRERSLPTVDARFLVTLWAAMALVFYFALALSSPRYAASAVMFAWPAVVGEVARRRSVILRAGLTACLAISLVQTSHRLANSNPPAEESSEGRFFRAAGAMSVALREVPPSAQQVYVLSAGGLVPANAEYLQALLGMRAKIIRIVDAAWECRAEGSRVVVVHGVVDGTVTLTATLPDCARFFFAFSGIDARGLVDGQIRRNASIVYEFPDARAVSPAPGIELGRRMTVRIRPGGSARFIIEKGGTDGGITWFDTP